MKEGEWLPNFQSAIENLHFAICNLHISAIETMKSIGQILVWVSLAGGAMCAATAYLVSLDAPDGRLAGLTLAAPAGNVEQPAGTTVPLERPA